MHHTTYFSPAKINLTLKVLGKRSDGYHNLSSLMQTIDLGDTLHFTFGAPDKLTCTEPTLPTDSSNLVTKAVHLFRQKTGWNESVQIHLEKKIPSQAGLGGGSSNAATTLWALNEQAGKPATTQLLQTWSAEIGSDIPFFFSLGTAQCEGRGEIVKNLPPQKLGDITIIKPSIGLSTADVFRHFILGNTDASETYFNDLEAPAFQLCPELKSLKNELQNCRFTSALMTGSGSAFFCLGEGQIPAIPNLFSSPAKAINRKENEWY